MQIYNNKNNAVIDSDCIKKTKLWDLLWFYIDGIFV